MSPAPKQPRVRALRRLTCGAPCAGGAGAGNHYCEIQVVDEIYEKEAAQKMGVTKTGQVVIMIHSGSRGLGHQVIGSAHTTPHHAPRPAPRAPRP